MIALLKDRWFGVASFALLFATIIIFAYTNNYFVLAAPFGFLFVVLLGVNWKTAYWIFLFSIPVSIQIDFAGDTASITLPDQPIMWLFLFLVAMIMARNPKALPDWWWKDKITLIVVLQFIWTIVAVIFSKMLFFSLKFLLAKTWLLVAFFVMPVWIFKDKKDFIRGFYLLLVPMLATVIVVLIHHAFLGFRFDKVQRSMSGLYYNHVDYSTVISMFLPLLLVAVPLSRRKSWFTRAALYTIIAIFIAGIAFAYARAAIIGVVFALVVMVAMRLRLVNLVMPVIYALMILLVAYMVPNNKYLDFRPDYNNTYMHKNFVDHLISTFRGKDMSSMERVYRWIAAVRMSKDEPITGYGPRAFVHFYKPYAVTAFRTYVSRNPEQSTTHNYFIYMMTEQGYPAMLLYAILMYAIFAKAQRVYHRFKDRFYKLVTMGLTMTIAVGFINNFFSELIEQHKVAALFYIPIVMLIILDKKSKEEEARGPEAQEIESGSMDGWEEAGN